MPRTLSLTLLAIAFAAAEESPTIIVTAERRESDLLRAPVSVSVVEADQIAERGYVLNGSDWLRGLAGVSVLNRNGSVDGGVTNVRIRGVDPVFTQFLVDGLPLNDPTTINGDFNPSKLNLGGVQRVEVLKGPQSGLYGSRSIGGVVNYITARPTAEAHGEVRLTAGSFGTGGFDATATGPLAGGLGYAVSASGLASDGFSSITTKQSDTPGDPQDFEADAVHRLSVQARIEGKVGKHGDWYVGGMGLRNETEFDEASPDDALPVVITRSRRVTAGGGIGEKELRLSADAAFSTMERDTLTHYGPPPTYDADHAIYAGKELYTQAKLEGIIASDLHLALGVDGRQEQAEQYYEAGAGGWDETNRTLGVYGQMAYDVGRWTASLVGRVEDNQAFGEAVTGRAAGACWIVDGTLKLRGSVGNGFRAPSLYQLNGFEDFGAPYGFQGNPDLQPEKAYAYEAGTDWLVNDQVQVSATAFRTDYTQKIAYDSTNPINTYVNIDSKAYVEGFEGSIDGEDLAVRGLSLNLHATLLHSDDGNGYDLPYVASATGGVRLGYRHELESAVLVSSLGYEQSTGLATALQGQRVEAGFGLADASVGLEFADHYLVSFRVENLLDEHYVLTQAQQGPPGTDYSTAPRSFYVNLGAKF